MSQAIAEPRVAVTPEALLERLRWRYAVKKFDPSRKIPPATWNALEDALVLSPSSFGLQPWKFFVVNNPELRKKLQPVSWGQTQVVDASHLVVFARKRDLNAADVDRHINRIVQLRGPSDSVAGYRKIMADFVSRPRESFDVNAWASRQVYIALGFFLESAALLGVDACPMEGLDPARYDELLGLEKKGYATLCAATAGFRAADDKYAEAPKARFSKNEVIETL
jgi:nitroreductase